MANSRLSSDKQALILAVLSEGMAINATCRMFKVGKNAVLRLIDETGEAMAVYMRTNFRELPCEQVAFDEAWQYVGKHGQRMAAKEDERGDFWLWGAICNTSRLVLSWHIGSRKGGDCAKFVHDVAARVKGKVQITTDALSSYQGTIRMAFGERASHAVEIKEFFEDETNPAYQKKKNGVPKIAKATRKAITGNPDLDVATTAYAERLWLTVRQELRRLRASHAVEIKEFFEDETNPAYQKKKNGVPKIAKATRKAITGNPDLDVATTAYAERLWLTVRQELRRFGRLTLGYSKSLDMHKRAVAMHLAIYNLVRKHTSLDGMTPAQAAGVEYVNEPEPTPLDFI